MTDTFSPEWNVAEIEEIAREIVKIERQCFYGDEPERDRLRKIREKINGGILNAGKEAQ